MHIIRGIKRMPNMKIPLFHCNLTPIVAELLALRSVVSNHPMDIYWEGDGMYFWDNFGNTRYWQMQKAGPTQIVECSVEFDYEKDLLDLTDLEQERVLAFSSYLVGFSETTPVGIKIDYLCQKAKLKVVRGFGRYDKTPQTTAFHDKYGNLSNRIKVIYCIKPGYNELLQSARIAREEDLWSSQYVSV